MWLKIKHYMLILIFVPCMNGPLLAAEQPWSGPCETPKCVADDIFTSAADHIYNTAYQPPVVAEEPSWEFIKKDATKVSIVDLPSLLSFPKVNEHNHMIGYRGFNIALGYSSKTYFRPIRTKSFNPHWSWGTILLAIPYFGFGTDYYFSEHLSLGFTTIYIIPIPHLGVNF
ncbi:hypothetical protein OAJ27_02010 [bacterium]|nr:hypothetical protein [bacterium]